MKVIIDNSNYALKNLGDLAMLITAVQRIHEISPIAQVYVLTSNAERLKKYIPNAIALSDDGVKLWLQNRNLFGAVYKLFPAKIQDKILEWERYFRNKFSSLSAAIIAYRFKRRNIDPEPMLEYLRLLRNADYVVATGGGFITDSFYHHGRAVLLTLELGQNLGKKTSIFGQGLGPLTDKSVTRVARRVLPRLETIGLREGVYSRDLALELGASGRDIYVTGDDAIMLATQFEQAKGISNTIGVNLRIAGYSGLDEAVIQKFKSVINAFAEKHSADFTPVPISFHDEDSDLKSIISLLGVPVDEKINNLDVFGVIEEIAKCRLLITGSYHAGVFALTLGIPVIAVIGSDYYAQKFIGLQGQFKEGIILLNLADGQMTEALTKALEDAWSMDSDVSDRTRSKAYQQVDLSKQLYETVFK